MCIYIYLYIHIIRNYQNNAVRGQCHPSASRLCAFPNVLGLFLSIKFDAWDLSPWPLMVVADFHSLRPEEWLDFGKDSRRQRKQIHRVWRDCVNDVKIPEHTLPSLKHLSVYPIICHPKSTCAWPMERSNLQMKGRSEQEFQMTSILRSCKLRILIRLWWLVVSHHNSELLSCQAVYWDLLGLRSCLAFGSSKIPGPGGSHQPTTDGWLDIVDCLAFLKLNPSMFRGFQRDLSCCIHRICITGDFNIWVWVNTY